MTEGPRPAIDRAVLDALEESVGDREFVEDLVRTYLTDAEDQMAAITAAVDAGNAEALVRPAHSLKSASFTIGAQALGETSRALEQAARSGSLDGAEALAGQAREELRAVATELARWLDGDSAG